MTNAMKSTKTVFGRITRGCVVIALCAAIVGAGELPSKKKAEIERNIDALLKKMTLEEKVGQMTQVTIDVVSVGNDGRQEPHAIDASKLEQAILQYHVGSIINVGPSWYSFAHWHEVITKIQDVATKKSRLKIPVLYGIDAIHGATYTQGGTLFPQSIGLAATWNPEMARQIGDVTALDVRASGIPWNFHPVLDVGRQPLWPRFWETYGEDVYLAKTLATAYIDGLMGDDMSADTKLAPCLKHYAGYSFPLSGKDRTPAWIDERMMRQYFLPTFEAGVKAGVPTVMVNSSEINGIPGHANYHLLTEVLKQEWDFQGFVVSDWLDIERLHTRDGVAKTPKDAARIAVMAGIDMSMVPLDYSFYDYVLQLVHEGSIPTERIDDAVRRILRVKYLVGLFERPYPNTELQKSIQTSENDEFNREVARDSMTLLKNSRSILPLKKTTKVLVTGPTANMLSVLNSGWTITWQGDDENLYPKDKPTILAAIRAKVGEQNVQYAAGVAFDKVPDLEAAMSAGKTADVIIACLGEKAYCETTGNVDDLTLDESQLQLVNELTKLGKPIIVVLAEGRPRIIHPIIGKADAILLAYLPGMEGGNAVADVVFGDAVPSGKLPFSYPKYPNALVCYDAKQIETMEGNKYDPEFPFGFGLSYTTFQYSNLKLSNSALTNNGNLEVSVDIKNTGAVEGKEVVQMYVRQLYRSISPPVKELKSFKKVSIKPGETANVKFAITPADLAFVGLHNKWITEKGEFQIFVDNLGAKFELQ